MSNPAEPAEELEKPYLKKDGEFFCSVTALNYDTPRTVAKQRVHFIAHKKPEGVGGSGCSKYSLVDTEGEYSVEFDKVEEPNESGDWGVTAQINR